MGWQVVTSEDREASAVQWAQWVDVPAAEGWVRELARLVALPRPEVGEGMRRTVELAHAVGALYAALDLPPFVDPVYFAAWTNADRGSVYHGAADWLDAATHVLGRYSEPYRAAVEDGATIYVDLVRRVQLTREGRVAEDGGTLQAPPVDRHDADGTAQTCGDAARPSPWDCWVWSWWVPGVLDADRDVRFAMRVPVAAHWDLFEGVARSIAAAGWRAVLRRARRWVVVKNLRTARELGGSRAEDILRAGAEADLERLAQDEGAEATAAVGSALATIFAVAGATGFGAIFAVTAGIPAALIELFGRAVGRGRDVFGRTEPVYELASISGAFGPAREPTHEVPRPPREGRGPELLVPVWIPPGGGPGGPDVVVLGNRSANGSGVVVVGLAALVMLAFGAGRRSR